MIASYNGGAIADLPGTPDSDGTPEKDGFVVAAVEALKLDIRLSPNRTLKSRVDVQGQARLEGLSLVKERDAGPDEYQVIVEVHNAADVSQHFYVDIMLRSATRALVGYEHTFIDDVPAGARRNRPDVRVHRSTSWPEDAGERIELACSTVAQGAGSRQRRGAMRSSIAGGPQDPGA